MPYVVTCPSCSKRLKTAAPVPAGRAVTCPHCGHAFTTKAAAAEVAAAAAPPPPRKPAPPKRAKQEEELAAAEILDDDEEDDRPRAKKSRREKDDEEDDRPIAKKKRDDDDRPRTKRRQEADDDRPAPRKNRALLWSLAVGLPVLLVVAAVVLWLPAGRGKPKFEREKHDQDDPFVWLPSETEHVRKFHVASLIQQPFLKTALIVELDPVIRFVSLDEVESVYVVKKNAFGSFYIVKTKNVINTPELIRNKNASRINNETDRHAIYSFRFSELLMVAAPHIFVVSASVDPAELKALSEKKHEPTYSDKLGASLHAAEGVFSEARAGETPPSLFFSGVPKPVTAWGGGQWVNGKMAVKHTLNFKTPDDAARFQTALQNYFDKGLNLSADTRGVERLTVTVEKSRVVYEGVFTSDVPGNVVLLGF